MRNGQLVGQQLKICSNQQGTEAPRLKLDETEGTIEKSQPARTTATQQLIRLGACCTTVQPLGVVVGWRQRRPRVVLDRPELELRPRVLSQWR